MPIGLFRRPHLVIYNSGSTLNKRELSPETLGEILEYASSLQNCQVVSLDSREMYITRNSLDYLVNTLRPDQQARAILGIESQNDDIRIGKLNKRMSKQSIERAFAVAGEYQGTVGIDVNILFQPPEVTGKEAIAEAVATVRYSLDLAEEHQVPVDFNVHPYYPSKRSAIKYHSHPRAEIADATEALRQMAQEIRTRGISSNIFIGWQDEGHDQEQEKRQKELAKELAKFDRFNQTQDPSIL